MNPAKLLTEFVGTFLFLFCISLLAVSGSPFTGLGIGAGLMAMVYMGGHVSGAHYNPAVSLAIMARGKMTFKEFGGYAIVQIIAGVGAFMLGYWITGHTVNLAPVDGTLLEGFNPGKAVVLETVFTFMLALVVLNVATAKSTAGNSFYGLAIGITIVVAAYAAGPLCGGAFNPAVGIGATVSHAMFEQGTWSSLWIYLVGPLLGGLLAAIAFNFHNPAETE